MKYSKKAVVFGAGSIGRGFIGQILHDSGYQIVFIDVNDMLIQAINCHKAYLLTLTDGQTSKTMQIDHISAVHASETTKIVQILTDCDLTATAVGKNALHYIAPVLAAGLRNRHRNHPDSPLNILICENINHARAHMFNLLEPFFANEDPAPLKSAGLVQTTIGRMVPVPKPVTENGEIPPIVAEPYCCLPIEQVAFRGSVPLLRYTDTFEPFAFHEERKLFIHNLGHAACAYFGALKNYKYIWQAIGDPEIAKRSADVMNTMALAIAEAYQTDETALLSFAEELIIRFSNQTLGDTVARVCKDPLRKLQKNDRFIGALERCKKQEQSHESILCCIAAALLYKSTDDPASMEMQEMIAMRGIDGFLSSYCELSADDRRIVALFYCRLKRENQ